MAPRINPELIRPLLEAARAAAESGPTVVKGLEEATRRLGASGGLTTRELQRIGRVLNLSGIQRLNPEALQQYGRVLTTSPRELAARAARRQVPENPLLKKLTGYSRADMADEYLQKAREGRGVRAHEYRGVPTTGRADQSEAARALTPENIQRLVDAGSEFMKRLRPDVVKGMLGWYHNDPLLMHRVRLVGPEKALPMHVADILAGSVSSAQSSIPTEIRRGSALMHALTHNLVDDFIRFGGHTGKYDPLHPGLTGPEWRSAAADALRSGGEKEWRRYFSSPEWPGHGYWRGIPGKQGHLEEAHRVKSLFDRIVGYGTGKGGAEDLRWKMHPRDMEAAVPTASPKTPAYASNQMPFEIPGVTEGFKSVDQVTADAHNVRAAGLPLTRISRGVKERGHSVEGREVPFLHELNLQVARALGLPNAAGQSLNWGGFGDLTGLADETLIGVPKAEAVINEIPGTARRLGLSAEDTFKRWGLGDIYLSPEGPDWAEIVRMRRKTNPKFGR